MTPAEQHRSLSLFVTACHEVLEANMWKAGWDQDDPGPLMTHAREEMIEVEHELVLLGTSQFSLEAMQRECCDVALMIMMVFDSTRRARLAMEKEKVEKIAAQAEYERIRAIIPPMKTDTKARNNAQPAKDADPTRSARNRQD